MQWIGFNFLWLFSHAPGRSPGEIDHKALDFMAKHGFNFARLACDYRFWTDPNDYSKVDADLLDYLSSVLEACRERKIHFSLNMHRVPGYCINQPEIERHNLWQDLEAQDGFTTQWEILSRHFQGVPGEELSFDLVNEPPDVGQYGMTREVHAQLIRRVASSIRAIDEDRTIVIDGLGGGHLAMPELADLGAIHSGRGYQPMPVSHHQAEWWTGWKGHDPVYPNTHWDGKIWNQETLREFYQPWRDVEALGVPVHIGEFGCYDRTPIQVAQAWLGDLVGLWREFGWGWALWNFVGDFGIIGHRRTDARWETLDGYQVDRDLFEIVKP